MSQSTSCRSFDQSSPNRAQSFHKVVLLLHSPYFATHLQAQKVPPPVSPVSGDNHNKPAGTGSSVKSAWTWNSKYFWRQPPPALKRSFQQSRTIVGGQQGISDLNSFDTSWTSWDTKFACRSRLAKSRMHRYQNLLETWIISSSNQESMPGLPERWVASKNVNG